MYETAAALNRQILYAFNRNAFTVWVFGRYLAWTKLNVTDTEMCNI